MTPFGESLYWRESQKPARFGPLDYRAVVFVLPIMFYFRFITIIIAMIALAIFFYLDKKKIQPDNVLRWIRSTLAGAEIPPQDHDAIRRPVDFGFEDEEVIERHEKMLIRHVELVKQGKRRGASTLKVPEGTVKSKIRGITHA